MMIVVVHVNETLTPYCYEYVTVAAERSCFFLIINYNKNHYHFYYRNGYKLYVLYASREASLLQDSAKLPL